METDLNEIIKFDSVTGLSVSTKPEILQDLINITITAFGNNFSVKEGSEWYTFLELMATTLTDFGNSSLEVYNSLSFVSASGITLDNTVALAGITRNIEKSSYVLITATADVSVTTPYSVPINTIIKDSNGNQWTNLESFIIDDTTKIGTQNFYALDGDNEVYNMYVAADNNATSNDFIVQTGGLAVGVTFINSQDSTYGNSQETDAQLRTRYYTALYTTSVGTVEGLRDKLIRLDLLTYGYVIDNPNEDVAVNAYDIPIHHLWAIVDGTSTWDGSGSSDDVNDLEVAETILDFKSIGCGTSTGLSGSNYNPTSGTGAINVDVIRDEVTYNVSFTRATNIDIHVEMALVHNIPAAEEVAVKADIEQAIKNSVSNYVNTLGIGNDVLNGGVSSAIYGVILSNSYTDYVFDIDVLNIGKVTSPATNRVAIDVFEYPAIIETNIVITWS